MNRDEDDEDDGLTIVAARAIPDDPDHVECVRCRERIGNTLDALWAHLGARHGMT